MPLSDTYLTRVRDLGRKHAASIALSDPLPGSGDMPAWAFTEMERLHGLPLVGIDAHEVEAAFRESLMDARCERGVTVRFPVDGQVSHLTLRGNASDVSSCAIALATTPPPDDAPSHLRTILGPLISRPVLAVNRAGIPVTIEPHG